MTSELWQFAAFIAGLLVVAVLWLFIIYLPARTMEYSETRRLDGRDRGDEAPGNSG